VSGVPVFWTSRTRSRADHGRGSAAGASLRVVCLVVVALSACTAIAPSWAPLPPPARPSQPLRPVSYWQERFNDDEASRGDEENLRRSRSSDSWDFYFLSYSIDAFTSMFEATGEARYAAAALDQAESMVASARPSTSFPNGQGDQYLGWVSQRPDVRGEEVPLFESYCWRYVTRLLRVLRGSPLYQSPAYRDRYERLLAFAETNIFEKWYTRGADRFIYRSRTHMAAHWAYLALDLSKLTTSDARRARYHEVMRNIDDRLRAQLRPSRTEPSAYWWSDVWGEACTGRNQEVCQDVSHGNGMISYVVEARDLNATWSAEDIARFSRTFTAFVLGADGRYPEYVDGNGRGNGWIADGFVKLGRYDPAVQGVLQDYGVQDSQYYAAMAVNAKMLGVNEPPR
jgi:hypothetical protein